jgi:hypothetical protein
VEEVHSRIVTSRIKLGSRIYLKAKNRKEPYLAFGGVGVEDRLSKKNILRS